MSDTHLGTLRPTLENLAYASGCGYGYTAEECVTAREAGLIEIKPAKDLLLRHLTFMTSHPAARCFQDAHAADRAVAKTYLAWMATWAPMGGELTGQGRAQIEILREANAMVAAFLSKLSGYFSDCQ